MSISTVTSEALQLKLRQLLPSQQGFGTDLTAQDTIVPIIDLTRAAEGSDVSENLQTALAFGSQTAFTCRNTTVVIANTPGFYRIFANLTVRQDGAGNTFGLVSMSDGATSKTVWSCVVDAGTALDTANNNLDFNVFLAAGESISVETDGFSNFEGSVRQIADVNGTLVQPSGFTPQ